MFDEHPIARNQLQLFHRALSQKQPIEWVAGRRFGIDRPDRVAMVDHEEIQTDRGQIVRQIVEGEARIDFSKASLDCYFP